MFMYGLFLLPKVDSEGEIFRVPVPGATCNDFEAVAELVAQAKARHPLAFRDSEGGRLRRWRRIQK